MAKQEYPHLTIRFVTDTEDDPAVKAIAAVMAETGRGKHIVAGFDKRTCGKTHAELVGIADDAESEIHLILDSAIRPAPNFVRDMARPYVDPRVSVTSSGRWIVSPRPGLSQSAFTALEGFSPMLLALRPITYLWGGCFSIRRAAFEEWNMADAWKGTEDEDLIVCNALNQRRQKPVFVPTAVSPSFEAHRTLRGLMSWFIRQGQTARLHYLPMWILLVVMETVMCLGLLTAVGISIADIATHMPSPRLWLSLAAILIMGVSGILVRAPYRAMDAMPLPAWIFASFFAHFPVCIGWWLSINPKMRWSKMTLEFGRDGKIKRILNRHEHT